MNACTNLGLVKKLATLLLQGEEAKLGRMTLARVCKPESAWCTHATSMGHMLWNTACNISPRKRRGAKKMIPDSFFCIQCA